MNYYDANFQCRLNKRKSDDLPSTFLNLIKNPYQEKPSPIEEKWYQEARLNVNNTLNFYLPYLFAYDTSYLKKVNYRSLFQILYSAPIKKTKDLWMIVEVLQALDKMIYEEYRALINYLKKQLDFFIKAEKIDSFVKLVIIQSLINDFLPSSYEKYLKGDLGSSLQDKLIKHLITQYEKEHKI